MTYNRKEMHQTAIDVQNACNPRAVARLLVEAIDSACDHNGGTDGALGDSAVYLIMDKLASLGLYTQELGTAFIEHYNNCKKEAE